MAKVSSLLKLSAAKPEPQLLRAELANTLALELRRWRSKPKDATKLLNALAEKGHAATLVELLQVMTESQVPVNAFHLNVAIKACRRHKDWQRALQLLRAAPKMKVVPDRISYNAVIPACAAWTRALAVLAEMLAASIVPNEISYSSTINCDTPWPLSLQLLKEMLQEQLEPYLPAFNAAIHRCGAQWPCGLALLQQLQDATVEADLVGWNAAIGACEKASVWGAALAILHRMPKPDTVSFNTAMSACGKAKRWEDALALFYAMPASDTVSLNTLMSAFARGGEWTKALMLFDLARGRLSLSVDVYTITSVISACATASQWREALQLMKEMIRPAISAYNAAIMACDKAGQWEQALGLFRAMPRQSIRSDHLSCHSVTSACAEASQWQLALSLAKSRPSTVACSAAITAATRGEHRPIALQLFAEMPALQLQRDVVCHGAALCACPTWPEALEMLEQMTSEVLQPNEICFSAVIALCDAWEAALKLLALAREAAVQASEAGYGAAIRSCEASGQWACALQLLQSMSSERLDATNSAAAAMAVCSSAGRWEEGGLRNAALLREIADSEPSVRPYHQVAPLDVDGILIALDEFGQENLGWAKFAGGLKGATLQSAVCGGLPAGGHHGVFEIGTYWGTSSLRLAHALRAGTGTSSPRGFGATVTTVELDPVHVAVARVLFAFAGVDVQVLTGHSRAVLPRLGARRFAAVLMDRWGSEYEEDVDLLERLQLLKAGSVLVADNVLSTGAAGFLWRTGRGQANTASRYTSQIIQVEEVVDKSEDWISVSVLTAPPDPFPRRPLPEALAELQRRSSHLRGRVVGTNGREVAELEMPRFSREARVDRWPKPPKSTPSRPSPPSLIPWELVAAAIAVDPRHHGARRATWNLCASALRGGRQVRGAGRRRCWGTERNDPVVSPTVSSTMAKADEEKMPELDPLGSVKFLPIIFLGLALPRAIAGAIAVAIWRKWDTQQYEQNIANLVKGEHGYLYAAAALFGLMVHWINQFPMIYKHMLMRMNSGNLRANMMIYKQLGAKEDAPYVVLETQGPVGCYNRANRSLFHFTENSLAFVLCLLLAGVIFPLPALALTACFSVGRVVHQIGYATAGYGGHALGFLIAMLSDMTLQMLCVLVAIKSLGYSGLEKGKQQIDDHFEFASAPDDEEDDDEELDFEYPDSPDGDDPGEESDARRQWHGKIYMVSEVEEPYVSEVPEVKPQIEIPQILSSEVLQPELQGYGVLDTGATESVSSLAALEYIHLRRTELMGHGNHVTVIPGPQKMFRFGNGSLQFSESYVHLKQTVGPHEIDLGVFTLDSKGVPLLIGVRTLERLGAIIDVHQSMLVLKTVDPHLVIPLRRSRTGHLLLDLCSNWLDGGARILFMQDTTDADDREKVFAVQELSGYPHAPNYSSTTSPLLSPSMTSLSTTTASLPHELLHDRFHKVEVKGSQVLCVSVDDVHESERCAPSFSLNVETLFPVFEEPSLMQEVVEEPFILEETFGDATPFSSALLAEQRNSDLGMSLRILAILATSTLTSPHGGSYHSEEDFYHPSEGQAAARGDECRRDVRGGHESGKPETKPKARATQGYVKEEHPRDPEILSQTPGFMEHRWNSSFPGPAIGKVDYKAEKILDLGAMLSKYDLTVENEDMDLCTVLSPNDIVLDNLATAMSNDLSTNEFTPENVNIEYEVPDYLLDPLKYYEAPGEEPEVDEEQYHGTEATYELTPEEVNFIEKTLQEKRMAFEDCLVITPWVADFNEPPM
ncbi:Pentatricopeptide repeat-containing protein At2g41720 (Protein EMBRYO DEFECTIVE 2654) [Durusdinium trenchii]|uniref:Pentatricopeptide repeat-containing protein At2g41720 (Protein EMBRYO DEFECTIVE 2654) n=1 Tax=Durusdinium trenchii TaxID=1381693 RepID=A0ABP0PMQ2_9DINO